MARYRSRGVEFKRPVAQEFLAGETLHGLAKRHDISRKEGAFDDAKAADLVRSHEARIAALERLVGRQALAGPAASVECHRARRVRARCP